MKTPIEPEDRAVGALLVAIGGFWMLVGLVLVASLSVGPGILGALITAVGALAAWQGFEQVRGR